jgi:hypothetical protein
MFFIYLQCACHYKGKITSPAISLHFKLTICNVQHTSTECLSTVRVKATEVKQKLIWNKNAFQSVYSVPVWSGIILMYGDNEDVTAYIPGCLSCSPVNVNAVYSTLNDMFNMLQISIP